MPYGEIDYLNNSCYHYKTLINVDIAYKDL